MVFHDPDEDFIPFADFQITAHAVGHEVQTFAGVAREDDVFLLRRVDEIRHLLSGVFISIRCRDAQIVEPAERIGVFSLVIMGDRVEHPLRLLHRCRVVEVGQIGLIQNRKFLPNRRYINC